jgi:signal transduction histidine kinase/CheY-like chemotaxis protein
VLLALLLLAIGAQTARDINSNIRGLERTLRESAETFDSGGEEYEKIAEKLKAVDFGTKEGIEEGYHLLQMIVNQAKEDRQIAMEESEAKSLFLANMSHEIRTPMNGIIGFTELLKSTELNDEQREFANIIEKSSRNLLGIINNILDLSKIESNKVEVEHIAFDTHQEFDNTVDNFGVITAEKDIELYYYIDPTISPRMKGDPTKIKEILTNLLNNAVKFTDRGGEIRVEIRKLDASHNDRSLIEFSVSDTGIGMSPAQLKKIFQPFTQADSSVTRKYGGTGLGLTITKEYVELMGGKLNVESEEGKGTTFSFTLPLEEIPDEEHDYRNTFNTISFCRYKGESTARLNDYLDRYASYFGMRFVDFSDVASLQEAVKEERCSAILFDYEHLPEAILEAIEHLPSEELFLLAKVTSRQSLEAYDLPAENIFYKPLTYTKVLTMLRTVAKHEMEEKKGGTAPKVHTKYEGKVLVVEDNVINQKLVKNILEGLGLTVELAHNGLEAFEKRRSTDYDLIFMDIQMPVMNGVEATHEILEYEEDEELPHVPIVALTANALKGDRERFLAEGMDEYISKPIEMSELIYILNKFLHDKSRLEMKTEPEEESMAKEGGEAKEFLVAKNLPFSRKLLSKMLHTLGYPHRVATTPEETLQALESGKYAVIFTDESMLNDAFLQKAKARGTTIVFTSPPEDEARLSGLEYRVYNDKMTRENFEKFIQQIKGAQ